MSVNEDPRGSAQASPPHIFACPVNPKSMVQNTSFHVVIATTDLKSRVSLLTVLRSEPGFTVIGEVSGRVEFLALPQQLEPDILLLDFALIGLVDEIVNSWPAVRIILLAAVIDQRHVLQALRVAARGLVLKTAAPQMLLKSIRGVLADEYWLGADSIAIIVKVMRDLLSGDKVGRQHERCELTTRENTVVGMITTGCSNRQIGQELSISERTVKHHLTSIFGKLGITSRLQLATLAVKQRLQPNAACADASLSMHPDLSERRQAKPVSDTSFSGQ